MFRSGGWPRAKALALVAVVVGLAAACANHPEATSIDSDAFAAAMQERFGVDGEQANCITEYVFDDYDADEIEILADEGMGSLPQTRWEPYLNATVACITHDEPLPGVP